jgi:hypothetical protein
MLMAGGQKMRASLSRALLKESTEIMDVKIMMLTVKLFI